MRTLIAVTILLTLAMFAIADARIHRVQVTAPPDRTNAEIICPYVTGSVAWDLPPAQQRLYLGVCPPPAAPR
jgi:hypothetical protein